MRRHCSARSAGVSAEWSKRHRPQTQRAAPPPSPASGQSPAPAAAPSFPAPWHAASPPDTPRSCPSRSPRTAASLKIPRVSAARTICSSASRLRGRQDQRTVVLATPGCCNGKPRLLLQLTTPCLTSVCRLDAEALFSRSAASGNRPARRGQLRQHCLLHVIQLWQAHILLQHRDSVPSAPPRAVRPAAPARSTSFRPFHPAAAALLRPVLPIFVPTTPRLLSKSRTAYCCC